MVRMPVLQWGHDKIVMEVGYLIRSEYKGYTLQWGHDKIVMEVRQLMNRSEFT